MDRTGTAVCNTAVPDSFPLQKCASILDRTPGIPPQGIFLAKSGRRNQNRCMRYCPGEVLMKRTLIFLSVVILAVLVLPPAPEDLSAAQPQDVMTGYWVLKFDDGREGWANLVSDDYPKTGFSSKGKVKVPGFKQVDITSGVIPDLYKVGQVILYNAQATQKPFHFVRFVIEGNQFMTGYVATFDSKQYRFKAHRR